MPYYPGQQADSQNLNVNVNTTHTDTSLEVERFKARQEQLKKRTDQIANMVYDAELNSSSITYKRLGQLRLAIEEVVRRHDMFDLDLPSVDIRGMIDNLIVRVKHRTSGHAPCGNPSDMENFANIQHHHHGFPAFNTGCLPGWGQLTTGWGGHHNHQDLTLTYTKGFGFGRY